MKYKNENLVQKKNLHRISDLTVECKKIRRNTKGASNEDNFEDIKSRKPKEQPGCAT